MDAARWCARAELSCRSKLHLRGIAATCADSYSEGPLFMCRHTHCALPMVASSLLSCEKAAANTSKSCSCRQCAADMLLTWACGLEPLMAFCVTATAVH